MPNLNLNKKNSITLSNLEALTQEEMAAIQGGATVEVTIGKAVIISRNGQPV